MPQPASGRSLQQAMAAAHATAEREENAVLAAKESEWQNFNDANLAELAHQKAEAERAKAEA